MKRAWFFIGFGLAVVLAVAGYRVLQRPTPQPQLPVSAQNDKSDTSPPASPTTSAPGAQATAAPTASVLSQPVIEGPIGDTYAALAARAEAGDADAAIQLAEIFGTCRRFKPSSRVEAETAIVDVVATFLPAPNDDAEQQQQDQRVAFAMREVDKQHTYCPGIDTLGIADLKVEQRRWIALAAQLGHPRGLLLHSDVLIDVPPGDIVDRAEAMRPVLAQARAALRASVMAGEPLALLRIARAHHTGDLAERDPALAYAWLLAYRDGPASGDVAPFLVDRMQQQYEAALTAEQRDAARARADALRGECCGGGG